MLVNYLTFYHLALGAALWWLYCEIIWNQGRLKALQLSLYAASTLVLLPVTTLLHIGLSKSSVPVLRPALLLFFSTQTISIVTQAMYSSFGELVDFPYKVLELGLESCAGFVYSFLIVMKIREEMSGYYVEPVHPKGIVEYREERFNNLNCSYFNCLRK